jgi:hydrogenase maturation protease
MSKETVVLGLGNPLMGDEGVGTKIIEIFQSAPERYPGADFIDAGTGGMRIVHLLNGRKKAVLIDCALMGAKAGTIKRFTPEQVKTKKKLAHQSLHDIDIMKVLDLAGQLGQCPDEVVIFGIEPAVVEQRMCLSEALEGKLDDYVEAIGEEL